MIFFVLVIALLGIGTKLVYDIVSNKQTPKQELKINKNNFKFSFDIRESNRLPALFKEVLLLAIRAFHRSVRNVLTRSLVAHLHQVVCGILCQDKCFSFTKLATAVVRVRVGSTRVVHVEQPVIAVLVIIATNVQARVRRVEVPVITRKRAIAAA